MINRLLGYFVLLIVFATVFIGCIEVDDVSEIPEIKYVSSESDLVADALGNESKYVKLVFNLLDGDGNVGLLPEDSVPPFVGAFRHNFFYDLLVKENSRFKVWDGLVINYFDIPFLEPQGQNKLLNARVSIDFYFPTLLLPYDTVYLKFFIYDRAFNRSNVDSTQVIIFN